MSAESLERGMTAVALAAGERLRELFRSDDLNVREKSGPGDLVTKADMEATEIALDLLERYFPEIPVVGEESGGSPGEGETFYLDPLDGTLNFVHGYPEFAVSLGLWTGATPIAGVVYAPVTRELYYAATGSGAYRNGRPIRCSSPYSLDICLLASGWPYDRERADRTGQHIARLARMSQDVRVLGSAALALCHVASGVLDGYFEEGLQSWDLAGGAAIAVEAGASISDLNGGAFSLARGEATASGAAVHDQLVKALKGHSESSFR